MSSAASSQDSLHRGNAATMAAAMQQQHLQGHQAYPGLYNAHGLGGPGAPGPGGLPPRLDPKKKGVKSTLGRIFGGKKEKQLKAMKVAGGGYVTGPMVNSPSGGFQQQQHGVSSHPAYSGGSSTLDSRTGSIGLGSECDIPMSESMGAGLGGLAGKGDFDRRKKKK